MVVIIIINVIIAYLVGKIFQNVNHGRDLQSFMQR